MKTLIRLLMILLVALMLPVVAFCQEVSEAVATVVGFSPASYFVSLSALATAVITITQWLKGIINSTGVITKLVSWLISITLAFIGWWFNLGIFDSITWYWVIIYAVGAGLIANSIFDLSVVTALINLFKTKENG